MAFLNKSRSQHSISNSGQVDALGKLTQKIFLISEVLLGLQSSYSTDHHG